MHLYKETDYHGSTLSVRRVSKMAESPVNRTSLFRKLKGTRNQQPVLEGQWHGNTSPLDLLLDDIPSTHKSSCHQEFPAYFFPDFSTSQRGQEVKLIL